MSGVIGDVLGPAVGILLSPLPIVGMILMLLSPKAKQNGPAFAAGWVLGLLAVVTIVLLVADPAGIEDSSSDPSTWKGVVFLLLGIGLILLALKQWQQRPKEGEEPELPNWMAGVDKMTPAVALGLGALLSGLNPKNLMLDIAAGLSIASADISNAEKIFSMLVFVVIASLAIVGLVIWYLLAGTKAEATLNSLRGWLVQYNPVIMAVLLLVLGANLIGKALPGLFG